MSEPDDTLNTGLNGTDVCILAGGMGTRIRDALPDTPKVLAPINGAPFLDHLINRLYGYGARRIMLSLGHLADHVLSHLDRTQPQRPHDLTIEIFVENSPQGTLGALRSMRAMFKSDPVIIMNGDSWVSFDLRGLLTHHRHTQAEVCLLCVTVEDAARYGKVETTPDGYVHRFVEKQATDTDPGVISAGVYTFSQSALSSMSETPGLSLERDFFQSHTSGTLAAKVVQGVDFIDIGTPESLIAAGQLIGR